MQILVIEDDDKLASSLQGGLQAEGLVLSLARTGEDGFYVASRNLFDIVLLNIMLPSRSGLEILTAMREL
jgi:DNA-binding response OmpR family regulator